MTKHVGLLDKRLSSFLQIYIKKSSVSFGIPGVLGVEF